VVNKDGINEFNKNFGCGQQYASHGIRKLKKVLDMIKRYDAKTRLLDLREITMPIFNPDSLKERTNRTNEFYVRTNPLLP